jgi:hypothetical protein
MGSGLTTSVRTSLLDRLAEESQLPLDLSDILSKDNKHRQRAHMIEEVRRIRSLLHLADSGRRMSVLQFTMEQNEPIAIQIQRVRNLARDKQRVLDDQKRAAKKKKFQMKLQRLPKRKSSMEESVMAAKGPVQRAQTFAAPAGTSLIVSQKQQNQPQARISLASKFWSNRNSSGTEYQVEIEDQDEEEEQQQQQQQQHRVVIVDDSKAYTTRLRRLIERVLFGAKGVEILTFSDVHQAESHLTTNSPTLVFMDNIFPTGELTG